MSLRTRLIVGVLVLVAVAVGAVSVITWVALRAFLIDRLDDQLQSTPPSLVGQFCARDDLGGPGPGGHPPRPPRRVLIARLDPEGVPTADCRVTGLTSPLELSPADGARLAARIGLPTDLTTGSPAPGSPADGSDGEMVRALARPNRSGGLDVVAQSFADVRGTLTQLLVLELVVGGLALLGTGAVGAWGVRWGLRPLDRVTSTARAVAADISGRRDDEPPPAGDRSPDARDGSADPGPPDAPTGAAGLGRRVPEAAEGTEVGQLARAFNTLLDAVQTEIAARRDSEQRMRRFLADAGHELRTPLTSLRGYAELIEMRERRAGVRRDPESADALRRMGAEGARMSRLVEDLMLLARSDRAEGTTPRAEPVALDELTRETVADLRAAYPERRVELRTAPSRVIGDPDRLRQILANLLTNAAVHTRPDGAIRVQVAPRDGSVRLMVTDEGPGLTAEQAARAFDRFWRADAARTRVRGGSGLGLSIVDTLVREHGGTVELDSAPESGTRVTVRLVPAP